MQILRFADDITMVAENKKYLNIVLKKKLIIRLKNIT